MKERWLYLLSAVAAAVLLFFFYIKYVPLVTRFQIALLPVLLGVLLLTAWRPRSGTLFFVALFPLINSLPYFFGIYETTPHAPTALPLFLFYGLGWLVHQGITGPAARVRAPLLRPLAWFSLWIVISAGFTVFRFTNFYPVLAPRVYELVTNVAGVTAGGAIMSTLFFALNYLTGFAFFYLLLQTVNSRGFLGKLLLTLCLSSALSLLFGLFQHLAGNGLGNNLRGTEQGLINGTFKDAISFGAFVAIMVPLFLGAAFFLEGKARALPLVLCILSAYLVLFIGSRSGLVSFGISLAVFIALSMGLSFGRQKPRVFSRKILIAGSILALLVILTAVFLSFPSGAQTPRPKTLARMEPLVKQGMTHFTASPRFQLWRTAALIVRDYPLAGTGVGSYVVETSNYARSHQIPGVNPQSAENHLLQVGSEMGALGVLLSLWVFWAVVRQMRRGYQRARAGEKGGFILIGAMAGIISFFGNVQFHTYIGSYEIKYAFWILVALLFLGRPGEEEKREASPSPSGRRARALLILTMILGGAVHLWNSTHSLSLESRTRAFGLQQDFGLYGEETDSLGRVFRWSGRSGGRMLTVEKPLVEIPILASHPDIGARPVRVKIFVTGDFFRHLDLLAEIEIRETSWKTYTYDLSGDVGRRVIILFETDRTWNPLRTTGVPDPRNLGVAVGAIRFQGQVPPP